MSFKSKDITYGLIGWPVKQSLSPQLHNHWLEQQGINEHYGLLEIAPQELHDKVQQFVDAGLKGWNITVPHKIAIMTELDDIDGVAKAVGAVNTVKVNTDGSLFGTNTDVYGFMHNLQSQAPGWNSGKPALVIGAGGAARAAAYGLMQAGVPKIYVANRTYSRAEALCEELGGDILWPLEWQSRESVLVEVGLIVNTTTLGMAGAPALVFDLSTAQTGTVVYDIVYKPLMTKLLCDAEGYGLKTVTGFGMLVHQAAAAFKLWFDVSPDLTDGFIEELEERFT